MKNYNKPLAQIRQYRREFLFLHFQFWIDRKRKNPSFKLKTKLNIIFNLFKATDRNFQGRGNSSDFLAIHFLNYRESQLRYKKVDLISEIENIERTKWRANKNVI